MDHAMGRRCERASKCHPGLGRLVSATTGLGLLLAGCSEEEPPDEDALTIAAVRVNPPSGQPGDSLTAELLHGGRMHADEDESDYEVVWLGGCHNPPSGEYYGCLPSLSRLVHDLSSPVASTPAAVFEEHEGAWMGFVEELPGANTQGATLEEARENLKEAIQLIVEANRELAGERAEGHQVIREELLVSVG